jgi:hypothetical protein
MYACAIRARQGGISIPFHTPRQEMRRRRRRGEREGERQWYSVHFIFFCIAAREEEVPFSACLLVI